MIRHPAAVCAAILACSGCASSGIHYTFSNNPLIENGYVIEHAQIPFDEKAILLLPKGSEVRYVEKHDSIDFVIRKEQSVLATPAELMSIKNSRHNVGIAFKNKGGKVLVGTYGEYLIDGHGSLTVQVTATVPAGTAVEFDESLSGQSSVATNLGEPADGWSVIASD